MQIGFLTIMWKSVDELKKITAMGKSIMPHEMRYMRKQLLIFPGNEGDRPSRAFMDWHNERVYGS